MTGTLEGRVALVTGGRGGIGRAVCRRLADEGAHVVAADLDDAGSVGASDAVGSFQRLDVTSEAEVVAAIEAVDATHGRLDVVVNAAGIEIEETIEHTTLEQWNRIFAVNVTGTFLVSRHALPLLRRSPGASIVNFGSYDGFIADPQLAAYCATKGAVHALTRAMACDHGPEGIRVNAICPGYVDTPMLGSFFGGGAGGAGAGAGPGDPGDLSADVRAEAEAVHPLRTVGRPDDVANLVHWLASDEARYATGQLWVLDGGLSAQVQQMRL